MADNNRTHVIYLLGAGASAEAIPVVSEFRKGLELFHRFLADRLEHPTQSLGDYVGEITTLAVAVQNILNQSEAHATIDTLARRYYLTGNKILLADLKRVLTTFFYFKENCQIEITNKVRADTRVYIPLDRRYDSLLASILETPSLTIPRNIKFISWNYDGQIKNTFKAYNVNSEKPSDPTDAQYLKINGDYLSKGVKEIITTIENDVLKLIPLESTLNLARKVSLLYDSLLKAFPNNGPELGIRFAWEVNNEGIQTKSLEERIDSMFTEALDYKFSELVICGYSFPFYNRRVDEMIFRGADKCIDNAVLQYPAGEHSQIVEKINVLAPGLSSRHGRGQLFENGRWTPKDSGSFYIPLNAV